MLRPPRWFTFGLAFIGSNLPKFEEMRALAMVACLSLMWVCIGSLIENNRKNIPNSLDKRNV